MGSRPRLLDLFCGAGGAAVGYHRAGFDVVGVDHNPQPNYPFEFHKNDAISMLCTIDNRVKMGDGPMTAFIGKIDAIHASPPCQKFSRLAAMPNVGEHEDLITPTRMMLLEIGLPYVIENVPGAPLVNPVILCGTMFGLKVFRHRLFETSPWMLGPSHPSHGDHTTGSHRLPADGDFVTVAGRPGADKQAEKWAEAMGIDWMKNKELTQAIPPAYTEWIGRQMLKALGSSTKVTN